MNEQGCICHGCRKLYSIDFIIPDELWEAIKPDGAPIGAGLLCGYCIVGRISSLLPGFHAFQIMHYK